MIEQIITWIIGITIIVIVGVVSLAIFETFETWVASTF